MKSIAKALIYAVQYINDRPEDATFDDDVRALEDAASILSEATIQEKKVLVSLAEELGMPDWAKSIGIEIPE